jgi:dCTP deaminase
LEMINLGPWPIVLTPGMPICQLIVEMVLGPVAAAPNQFAGQARPAGNT